MKIIIGADHGGFTFKEEVKKWLAGLGHDVKDIGAEKLDPDDDYVDYAALVAGELSDDESLKGVLFCRNGYGTMITANRVAGVRCGLAFDKLAVAKGRNDDDINCLSIPSDYLTLEQAKSMVSIFLETKFSDVERYKRRLWKLSTLSGGCCGGC